MKSYRQWTPTQSYLLPPSPLDWLPKGHLGYFVLETVAMLDLRPIVDAIQAKDGRGERPYDPRMMVALILYAYAVGVFSSRKIAKATYEDVAFRVIGGGEHPHFTTINQFRLEHREALAKLFVQILQLCRRAGLVKLGHVSLDGTKVDANASKHKAMSHERMTEEEKKLRAEVEALMARADAVDREEDERYGVGCDPDDIPEELKRRETRIERLRAAKAELEREAAEARAAELREQAEAQRRKSEDPSVEPGERGRAATRARKSEARADDLANRDDGDDPPATSDEALPRHRVPSTKEGKPTPKAQRNFTDPESRLMVRGGAYVQAYNAHVAVDAVAQIIVAAAVSNQGPDQEYLVPMVDRVIANCGEAPSALSADNGFFSRANIAHCESRNVDPHIAVGREKHHGGEQTLGSASAAATESMRRKLETPEGRAIYAKRKTLPEPVFGQIKEARGFRRFLLRGLEKVRAEWAIVCTTHNLLKLYRARGAPRPLPALAIA